MPTILFQYTVPRHYCPEGTEWEPQLFTIDGPDLITTEGLRPTKILRGVSCWPIDIPYTRKPGDEWFSDERFISFPGIFEFIARKTIYGEKVLITLEAVPNDTQDI